MLMLSTPATASSPPGFSLEGLRLSDALASLDEHGIQVVFTDRVVPRSLRVSTDPRGIEPAALLEELLAEHGLQAIAGPRNTWIVVSRSRAVRPSVVLQGVVRSGSSFEAIAGASIRIVEGQTSTTSDLDGSFTLPMEGNSSPIGLQIQRQGYLSASLHNVTVGTELSPLVIFLDPAPVVEEELVVTTSQVSVLDTGEGGHLGLSREEIESLPHLGGDLFRAVGLLPGVSSNDVTAGLRVRGAHRSEVRIVLDGLELVEPYHLQDYDNALSLIAPVTLGGAVLSTGGFGANHGDRLAGLFDLTTRSPADRTEFVTGLSLANAEVGGAGSVDRGQGRWMAHLRRGSIDLIGRLVGDEDPSYWDGFGKIDYPLTPRHSLRLNALLGGDRLDFTENTPDDSKRIGTRYDRGYVWATHAAVLGGRWLVESSLGRTQIDRDRRGIEIEDDVELEVADRRDFSLLDLRQSWSWQVDPRHSVELGIEHRRFEAEYDYLLSTRFDSPLAEIRPGGKEDRRVLASRFLDRHTNGYVTDRVLLGERLTLELGLRYDRFRLAAEEHYSPRVNLAWKIGQGDGRFRLAWGRYVQSQRVNELLVEDKEPELFPAERSDHFVVGYERSFLPPGWGTSALARIELYRRDVANPRPRYENLYEPINTFPEAEPDRVRVAPDRSRAEGIEVFLRARADRIGWWFHYTYSKTDDFFDGVMTPRSFDQTHAATFDLDLTLGQHWKLNLAWVYHTGWPTTPIALVTELDDEGESEFTTSIGPRNSERLADYHRLDARISREWEHRWGEVVFYADAQNVYDRANPAGFDIEIDEELGQINRDVEAWTGLLPSAGIRIRF